MFVQHLADLALSQTVPSILLSMLGSVLAGEVLAEMKVRDVAHYFPFEVAK